MFGNVFQGTSDRRVPSAIASDRDRQVPGGDCLNNSPHPFRSLPTEATNRGRPCPLMATSGFTTTPSRRCAIGPRRPPPSGSNVSSGLLNGRDRTGVRRGDGFRRHTVRRRTPCRCSAPPAERVASIPFFRVRPRRDGAGSIPGATPMTAQPLDTTYEMQDIAPTPGAEVTAYFGCWLDINQPTVNRFPITPGGGDGPWPGAACQPIQELVPRPTPVRRRRSVLRAGPDQRRRDARKQRQPFAAQPGLLHSRTTRAAGSHTSCIPSRSSLRVRDAVGPQSPESRRGRRGAGRLRSSRGSGNGSVRTSCSSAGTTCRDSEVTLYFSDIDTADIQALASAFRRSPLPFEIVDQHTLRFRSPTRPGCRFPAAATLNIPALLEREAARHDRLRPGVSHQHPPGERADRARHRRVRVRHPGLARRN